MFSSVVGLIRSFPYASSWSIVKNRASIEKRKLLKNRLSHWWTIMPATTEQSCHIPCTWNDSWTVIGTMEESRQQRKKKDYFEQLCHWLLKNCTSDYWTVVLVTVEESWQRLLKSCTSKCWRIVTMTLEQSCQRMLNNYARDC